MYFFLTLTLTLTLTFSAPILEIRGEQKKIRVYSCLFVDLKASAQIRGIRGEQKKIRVYSCLFVDLKASVQIREIRGEQKKIRVYSCLSVDLKGRSRRVIVAFRRQSEVKSASVPCRFFRDFCYFVIFFGEESPSMGAKTSEME